MNIEKINQVTCFMYYMCNKWDMDEARFLFGKELGEHIFDKYLKVASERDTLAFYGELDNVCRNTIVRRAIELYKKESEW